MRHRLAGGNVPDLQDPTSPRKVWALLVCAAVVALAITVYLFRGSLLEIVTPRSDFQVMVDAAGSGNAQVVQAELNKRFDREAFAATRPWTPLHWAATAGHADVVRLFLAKGIDPDVRGGKGETSLMLAAWKGHISVIDALLSRGAKVDAVDNEGVSALQLVSRVGLGDMVKVLLANHANVNDGSEAKYSLSLRAAIQNGHADIVQTLVTAGAHVWTTEDLMAHRTGDARIKAIITKACPKCVAQERDDLEYIRHFRAEHPSPVR
jgi:Ankyrin repeats (3 copies)